MKTTPVFYILSKGRVAAINKKDGSIVWEIKLSQYVGSSTAHYYGQMTVEDDKLYIGSSGMLVCLNTKDGSLVWKNELKGWGYNFVSIAGVGNGVAAAAANAANAAAINATVVASS